MRRDLSHRRRDLRRRRWRRWRRWRRCPRRARREAAACAASSRGSIRAQPPRAARHLHRRHRGDDVRDADGAVPGDGAQRWGGATAAGWLYSAMPIGSLVIDGVQRLDQEASPRRGAAVVIAAALWGVGDRGARLRATLPLAVALPGPGRRRRHGERRLPDDDLERDHPRPTCAAVWPASR